MRRVLLQLSVFQASRPPREKRQKLYYLESQKYQALGETKCKGFREREMTSPERWWET